MKRFSAVLLIAILSFSLCSLFAFSSQAVNYFEVQQGIPVIDGKIDDIYLSSACISPDTTDNININHSGWGKGAPNTVSRMYAYLLWDAGHIYLAAQVFDSTINYFPYEDCYVESEGYAQIGDLLVACFFTGSGDYLKISMDAYGSFLDGIEASKEFFDFSHAAFASTVNTDEGYYIVEMALPVAGGLEEDTIMPFHIMIANAGKKIENGGANSSFGNAYGGDSLLFVSDAVDGFDPDAVVTYPPHDNSSQAGAQPALTADIEIPETVDEDNDNDSSKDDVSSTEHAPSDVGTGNVGNQTANVSIENSPIAIAIVMGVAVIVIAIVAVWVFGKKKH